MKIRQYQVDAFAGQVFSGNPAAICPLTTWLPDNIMQAIAAENNLSETAFFVPSAKGYALRWFAPQKEVKLCGHATLAAAHVLFDVLEYAGQAITFETLSGDLTVEKHDQLLRMNFPADPPVKCNTPDILVNALGRRPVELLAAEDYLAVFESEDIVRSIKPDPLLLAQLDLRGVCVTAPGKDVDFVSRFFAPKYGITEDPVTGSAHCELTPYWAKKFGKNILQAKQISRRGGDVRCELKGDRVLLSGTAVMFMTADIAF